MHLPGSLPGNEGHFYSDSALSAAKGGSGSWQNNYPVGKPGRQGQLCLGHRKDHWKGNSPALNMELGVT